MLEPWVYQIWEKVVRPLNKPRVELADKVAGEPSDGMLRI